MKNRLIRWLIAFVRYFQKPVEINERFLIVSTTGLGDSLWGTPALRSLKESFPNGYIALLTTPLGAEVFKHCPHIDEMFVLKKPYFLSWIKFFFILKRKNMGSAMIFHASQREALPFCALLGCSEIIGTEGINKGLDFLLTTRLKRKQEHEISRRLDMVTEAGGRPLSPFLELFVSSEDENLATNFLKEEGVSPYHPLIGMHPGAKDRFKQWDPEHFIEVGKRLSEHLGCRIIVSGTADEKQLVHSISSKIPGAVPLCGDLPVRAFASLIKKMSIFITNDTGPMHLAFAMHAPTVALFSPTDPRLCGPFVAEPVVTLSRPPVCSPCLKKRCREPFCLSQVSPAEVVDAALQLYYKKDHL